MPLGEGSIRRILVVDNHDGFRRCVCRALELEGFEVLDATGGTDALMILNTKAVDLVLTDLNMPAFSGLDLIHAIRASSFGRDLPVFVLSVAQTEERIREVMQAGADGYLQKPFDMSEFLERLRPYSVPGKES